MPLVSGAGQRFSFLFVVRRGMGVGMDMGVGMGMDMGMGMLRKSFVRSLGESHRRAASRGGEGANCFLKNFDRVRLV